MKIAFLLLVIMASALTVGWMLMNNTFDASQQALLREYSTFPIVVFAEDSVRVNLIRDSIKSFDKIENLAFEKGSDAARRVSEQQGMGVSDEQISRYYFPDILSIFFKADDLSLEQRIAAMSAILQIVDRDDIEPHEEAISVLTEKINRNRVMAMFANLLVLCFTFLLMLLSKLCMEQNILLGQKLNPYSIVDKIRYKNRLVNQAIVLTLVPVVVSLAIAIGLVKAANIDTIANWKFFAMQLIVCTLVNLSSLLIIRSRRYRMVLDPEINVVAKSDWEDEQERT